MNIFEIALKLFKSGKNAEQVTDQIVIDNPEVGAEEIAKAVSDAELAYKRLQDVASKAADIKAGAEFDAKVAAAVASELKKIDTGSIHGTADVKVTDNWIERYADGLKLLIKGNMRTPDESAKLNDYMGQMRNKAMAMKVLLPETDASGGYFADPEFDMELDKLVYEQFPLLNLIRVKPGDLKTEINSISTFDHAWRTNSNTAFSTVSPTMAQAELKYEDAGALIYIANNLMSGSAYNLMSELIQLGADSRGRFLTEQIVTGKTSGDKFNGMWFTSGITAVTAKNSGGTGRVTSADLTALFDACAAQTRSQGVFIMDTREIHCMTEEKGADGHYINAVEMINGKYMHRGTGKEIIPIDQVTRRSLNGTSASSGGSNVAVMYVVPSRFRAYQYGAQQIDTSREFAFNLDQTVLRFKSSLKWGIPTYSLSSFVGLSGVVYNAV